MSNNPEGGDDVANHPKRILRRAEVEARTGLSGGTIDNLETAGAFPPRIAISPRAVGWVEEEIDAWVEQRIRESRDAQAAQAAKAKRDPNRWIRNVRAAPAPATVSLNSQPGALTRPGLRKRYARADGPTSRVASDRRPRHRLPRLLRRHSDGRRSALHCPTQPGTGGQRPATHGAGA
jgi:prophage regulatory protein